MLEIFGKKERGQNMQRETKVLDMHGYKSINCKRYIFKILCPNNALSLLVLSQ